MAQHLETTSSQKHLGRVLTALIPSVISLSFQLLDFAQLNWIVVLAPLTGGRAPRSTIRRLSRATQRHLK